MHISSIGEKRKVYFNFLKIILTQEFVGAQKQI